MSPRPHEHALIGRIGAAFASLFFCVQMLVVAKAGHATLGIPILATLATPFALFAIFGVGRVWIEEHGIRVVNTGRTIVVAWDEIEHFSLGRHGLLPKVGIAEMRDGRRLGLWGIQGPNASTFRTDLAAGRLIAAMNAELERRRWRAIERELEPVSSGELYLAASR